MPIYVENETFRFLSDFYPKQLELYFVSLWKFNYIFHPMKKFKFKILKI